MNRRAGTLIAAIAVLLVVFRQTVGSQSPSIITLVDVPLPVYPPIAQSARVSGDVHVSVDVRPDGTVASAALARVEGFNRDLVATFFEQAVLEAARRARFRCDGCGETPQPYSLVFAFRLAYKIGRAADDLHPEVVTISPSQSRILIVGETPLWRGPVSRAERPRAARCLWLWHCEKFREPDAGEPEVVLWRVPVPAYPAAARAGRASADVEVTVAVRRDGKLASAAVGRTHNLVGSTPAIESAFQNAAITATRQATFFCRRCRRGTVPYSLLYAFRFDGVLASLELGYGAPQLTSSPSQALVSVAADVPILDAALGVRADTLPSACRLAPAQPAGEDVAPSGNPWTGDDRQLISLIRARIARQPGSDTPSRYELQLAAGVRQAYVAWYVDSDRETTAVYGLLFGDSDDARAFVELATSTGSTAFLVHHAVVVAVRGGQACATALAGLLKDRPKL